MGLQSQFCVVDVASAAYVSFMASAICLVLSGNDVRPLHMAVPTRPDASRYRFGFRVAERDRPSSRCQIRVQQVPVQFP
jgi:hypothetical protein